MRRKPRLDANQPAVVEFLRDLPGITVQSLASVGKGTPDLLIGFQKRNYLIELKNPEQSEAGRKLTPDETAWHHKWTGHVAVCERVSEILQQINYPISKLSASKITDLDKVIDKLGALLGE